MTDVPTSCPALSPWWRHSTILALVFGLSVLIYLATRTYRDAPPIPERAVDHTGTTVFTGEDVRNGQEVFLRYGLMENGTVWGHGAYLGPDFSAAYLHRLLDDAAEASAATRYTRRLATLDTAERQSVDTDVRELLRQNRYDARTGVLTFTDAEAQSYHQQVHAWSEYFSQSVTSAGLTARYIDDANALHRLTAFFAWTAWASIAPRPGTLHSYTNNFPY